MRAAIQKMNAKELSAFLEWNDVVLKWYQADHVKTMVLNATLNVPENYGSILADEMGLGKSIQSLSVQAALGKNLRFCFVPSVIRLCLLAKLTKLSN